MPPVVLISFHLIMPRKSASKRTTPKTLQSVSELLPLLKATFEAQDLVWFRGHANGDKWKLVPAIARRPFSVSKEMQVIKRFKQNAYPFLPAAPKEEWEWLFLLQHYGAPTRLLDWTENPLVALYFAVVDPKHKKKDGRLWCLLPTKLNEKSGNVPSIQTDLPSFGDSDELTNYLPTRVHGTNNPQSFSPIAAIGPRQFGRVYNQSGVFTITHRQHLDLETIADPSHLVSIRIPKGKKRHIQEELNRLGITKLAIFPELSNVAESAKGAC